MTLHILASALFSGALSGALMMVSLLLRDARRKVSELQNALSIKHQLLETQPRRSTTHHLGAGDTLSVCDKYGTTRFIICTTNTTTLHMEQFVG